MMALFDMPSTVPASLFAPKGGYNIIAKTADGQEDYGTIVTFDLLMKERHAVENEVSNQPIEKGSDLSYHIKRKLQQGSLTGLVTNWGLYNDSFMAAYMATLETSIEQRVNRSKVIWDMLSDMAKSAKRMKIVTSLNVYDDVIITSVEADRDPESGEAQEIRVQFQQLNVVTLRRELADGTVNIDEGKAKSAKVIPANKAAKQASPKKAAGKVSTQPAQYRGRPDMMVEPVR